MEPIFTKLIEQLDSSVFVLLVILGVAFWGVYRIARLIEQFTHHKLKIDKLDDLSSDMIKLTVKVDLIYQNTNPNKLIAAQSPISITPVGNEISLKINAGQILQKYLAQLTAMVDEACPKNAYDVQTTSMNVAKTKMMSLLNADEINIVKQVAYQKGLLAEDIMGIFGVMLRDIVLKNKKMAVVDVDKPQPQPPK